MKKLATYLAIIIFTFSPFQEVFAANSDACQDEIGLAENKAIITQVAIQNHIPPEILKSIAMRESKFHQFDENGQPLGSIDGGIGIMQITPFGDQKEQWDMERLANDIQYNVQIGAEVLLEKWNSSWFPTVNDHDWKKLEHWYFALLGYNGSSKKNDPSYTPEEPSYQEDIYNKIEDNSLVSNLTFGDFEAAYTYESNPNLLSFPQDNVIWEGANTPSTQLFRENDLVTPSSEFDYVNLRDDVDGQLVKKVMAGEEMKIVGGPYEINNACKNYVYYHVTGDNIDGYVASPYLNLVNYNSEQQFVSMSEQTQVVSADKSWTIKFNTSIDPDTVLNQTIYVKNEQGEKVRTTLHVSDDGKTITVDAPYGGYKDGKVYTLFVQNDLQSVKSKGLKEPKKIVFVAK